MTTTKAFKKAAEYEQSCADADRRLAELMGWHSLMIVTGIPPGESRQRTLPQWSRDDALAFQLMVQLELSPSYKISSVEVADKNRKHVAAESFGAHPSREAATRLAAVEAAIQALEAKASLEAQRDPGPRKSRPWVPI